MGPEKTSKILLLGSGELGKELVISLQRLGCEIVACDAYVGAPAMQVADRSRVFNMLDGNALSAVIQEERPDLIVPEVEAIATEVLLEKEKAGFTVIPSAKATNLTMNRDRIRDRATELGLRTARFSYAETEEELVHEANKIGGKVVIKPVMSSSGKGQSTAQNEAEVREAWGFALAGMRGNRARVIVEEFIDFDLEITLLTVKQKAGPTLFMPPIGHVQQRGDYQWSWQPADMTARAITEAERMAKLITDDLTKDVSGSAGLFGVEFFIARSGEVIFSELSPRPHDTGMVTLFTQHLSEFDLHARAILGLPIGENQLRRSGASYVILADKEATGPYQISGLAAALEGPDTDIRLFGKPVTKPYRRMGVALAPSIEQARKASSAIRIKPTP